MKPLPKPPYIVPLVGSVVSVAAQEWASGEPWFGKVPFATILALSLVFLAGLIVQDIYNPKSWLWENVRSSTKSFEIGHFLTKSYGPGRSLQLQLIAVRKFERCEIRATFIAKERTASFPRGQYEITWKEAKVGDPLYLPILSVAPAPGANHCPQEQVYWGIAENTAWGNEDYRDRRNQPSAIIEITIRARQRALSQSETLFAVCRNENSKRACITVWRSGDEILYAD